MWGPVVFNVLNLAAVVFVFSALTANRRIVWMGAWLFVIAAWVGQDYFSPQAFAFLLYLMVLGTALRWLAPHDGRLGTRQRRQRAGALALVAILSGAIAVSHALTGIMLVAALFALVAVRACSARAVLPIAAGVVLLWDLWFANDFVTTNLSSVIERINLPWATTGSSLARSRR